MKKIEKVFVDIGKVAWPHQYPNFIADLTGMASTPETAVLGLSLLGSAIVEYVSKSVQHSYIDSPALSKILFSEFCLLS